MIKLNMLKPPAIATGLLGCQPWAKATAEVHLKSSLRTQWNSIFEHFGQTLKKRLLYRSRCKIRFLKKKPVCDPCALKEDPD